MLPVRQKGPGNRLQMPASQQRVGTKGRKGEGHEEFQIWDVRFQIWERVIAFGEGCYSYYEAVRLGRSRPLVFLKSEIPNCLYFRSIPNSSIFR